MHCRYSNVYALWTEVHITSVLPPEVVYEKMVENHLDLDSYEQLGRRLNFIVHHRKENGGYLKKIIPIDEYTDTVRMEILMQEVGLSPDDEWKKLMNTNTSKMLEKTKALGDVLQSEKTFGDFLEDME